MLETQKRLALLGRRTNKVRLVWDFVWDLQISVIETLTSVKQTCHTAVEILEYYSNLI